MLILLHCGHLRFEPRADVYLVDRHERLVQVMFHRHLESCVARPALAKDNYTFWEHKE
jgi:hypothetical protein